MNLATDSLQRTCTGTVIIDLDGSGWTTTTGGDTSSTSTDIGTNTQGRGDTTTDTGEITSTNGPYVNTGDYTNGGDGAEKQALPDNVHFGPAGIGLLIMGFLVLGCK